MKAAWAIGSLAALLWGAHWVAEADSWWRVLVALSCSLAAWEALFRSPPVSALCLLVAAGVLFKVLLVGADQRAGIVEWASSERWELWMMLTWLGVGLLALRVSLVATACFAVVGIAFSAAWFFEALWFHVIAEIGVISGLFAIWRRSNGEHIPVVDDPWRLRPVGDLVRRSGGHVHSRVGSEETPKEQI